MPQIQTLLHDTVLHTNALACQIHVSGRWHVWFHSQQVNIQQSPNCLIPYSSPYRYCVPNIRKLICVVPSSSKWTCIQVQTVIHNIVFYTDTVPNIRKLEFVVPEKKCDKFYHMKNVQSNLSDRKWTCDRVQLPYIIQFSILTLCTKYQEAGMCGS